MRIGLEGCLGTADDHVPLYPNLRGINPSYPSAVAGWRNLDPYNPLQSLQCFIFTDEKTEEAQRG